MPYSPPLGSAVGFLFQTSYTPSDDINFIDESPTQGITCSGWDSLSGGWAFTVSWRQYIEQDGDVFSMYGQPRVYERFKFDFDFVDAYTPDAGDETDFPFGTGDGSIEPSGWASSLFGSPTVAGEPEIRPSGWLDEVFPSTHAVYDARRYLRPTSITGAAGTPTVTLYDRTVDLAGRSIVGSYGTPFVDYANRTIYPPWIAQYGFGTPLVGYHQTISCSGYEATLFGDTYVHDDTQQIFAGAGNQIEWGLPEFTRSPRTIEPPGFPTTSEIFPSTRWGQYTEVYNLRQYLRQIYAPDPTVDGGVFGEPIWMSVENRNRTMVTQGHRDDVFSKLAIVENAAVPILEIGYDATEWGNNLVAHAIRNVYPETFESFYCGPYGNEVANAARTLEPTGIPPGSFGTPAWSNPPQWATFVGHIDSAEYGTAFVSRSPRTLTVPLGPECFYGVPDVQLLRRYVTPESISPEFNLGTHYVEERFTIFYPSGWDANRMGLEHYVRNVTPEIRPDAYVQTEWGANAIRHQYRFVEPSGFDALLSDRQLIEYRTKTVLVPGFVALRNSPFTEVRNVTPDPPPEQRAYPAGRTWTTYGTPVVTRNEIEPEGQVHTLWGDNEVRLIGAIVPSIERPDPQFGTHAVVGPQYVNLDEEGIAPPNENLIGFPKPDLQPRTIWATFDVTNQAISNNGGAWELMDNALDLLQTGERPFFGQPWVSHGTREIEAGGDEHIEFGDHTVELEVRSVLAEGWRSQRFGIPMVPGEQTIHFYAGTNIVGAVGTPTVDLRDKEITVESIPMPGAGDPEGQYGEAYVDFFHRYLRPSGWDSVLWGQPSPQDHYNSPGLRVHPPEPMRPGMGVQTLWGDAFISHRIRYVYPEGFSAAQWGHTPGQFADRMMVRRRSPAILPVGIPPEGVGTPSLGDHTRNIAVGRISFSGAVPAPLVDSQNIIALGGYGFLDEVFGDVQEWEAGKIKPQGEEHTTYGRARIDRTVAPAGMQGEFGTHSVGPSANEIGWDELVFGGPVLSYADGNEFVCGMRPRALAVPEGPSGAFGTPSVS